MPEGTIPVAAGLVISGLSAYGFLSLTRYGLGTNASKPVAQLWFATFILAPGFFLPIEQEVGRALAHRRALGQGGLPVLRKAAPPRARPTRDRRIILLLAISPFITQEVFDGSWPLFGCLLLSFVGYALGHFLRGTFAGTGRFSAVRAVHGVGRHDPVPVLRRAGRRRASRAPARTACWSASRR